MNGGPPEAKSPTGVIGRKIRRLRELHRSSIGYQHCRVPHNRFRSSFAVAVDQASVRSDLRMLSASFTDAIQDDHGPTGAKAVRGGPTETRCFDVRSGQA
jgi:hypothetical protein